jgi:uncharacterized membrane protein
VEKAKNSSLFSLRNISFVVLAFAIGISGYLSWLKISRQIAVCVQGSIFDCGTVLNSAYSELGGIPIAWLGLGVNITVVILLLLESKVEFFKVYAPALIFGLVLFAALFSVYLIYVQAFLIQAYCPWCLTHEALIFVLFGLSVKRLLNWMKPQEEFEEEMV